MRKVIGLTGGIASGKSTVSRILKDLGAQIIDADVIGKKALDIHGGAYTKFISAFGTRFLNCDETVDRKRLGEYVFSNRGELIKLNEITHPVILKEIKEELDRAKGVTVLDCALLIEAGLNEFADEVWLVTAKNSERLKRIYNRDGLSAKHAQDRIDSQQGDDYRLPFADKVIDNSLGIEDLERAVKIMYKEFINAKN